jgi:hypothetical protein
MYESGTQPELQIEMGLVGALIVRPRNYNRGRLRSEVDNSIGGVAAFNGHNARQAYRNAATRYEREYLYFLTDMDSDAHWAVERDFPVDPATFFATSWFVNGRNGPDTLHPDFAGWLPNQPYGALTQSRPGERVLMRLVGAGRDLHPFHHHGNNAWIFAKDGQLFGGSNEPHPDLQHDWLGSNRNSQVLRGTSISNYTIQVEPGSTYDAIFTWTGAGLNWDIYGNDPDHIGAACGDTDDELAGIEDMAAFTSTLKPTEDPGSHCKPLQVVLPEQQSLTFGGLWTGSPYLGGDSALPPGEGGLNPNLGFSYIWHSHTEKELVNDDIFPGGMMTFIIVEPPTTCIVDGNDTCPE